MTSDDIDRLKWYGTNDYGTYYQLDRVAIVLERIDAASLASADLSDLLEVYNASLFIESGLFPRTYSEAQQAEALENLRLVKQALGQFFNALDEQHLNSIQASIPYEYRSDLLTLLTRHKVFERCSAESLFTALARAGVQLEQALSSRQLVQAYGDEVRQRLLSDARHAELLIKQYLVEDDRRQRLYLPSGLAASDVRGLLDTYLDNDQANPNYVQLLANAALQPDIGLDRRLKLKAMQVHARWTEDFFSKHEGISSSCTVAIADEQEEPVVASLDGLDSKLSYSRRWLMDGLDYPTILNNFIYLFEFVNARMLLTLPAAESQLGVMERVFRTRGRRAYPSGTIFEFREQASFMQTALYTNFLRDQGVQLEAVISWFFSDFMESEYGVSGFRFNSPSVATTYLEKTRQLLIEMESVCHQYTLFAEYGQLDLELLALAGEQVRFRQLPSVVSDKCLYAAEAGALPNILNLLFSDQSRLTYISEALQAKDAATLLIEHAVRYEDFREHQTPLIDMLLQQGVLKNKDGLLRLESGSQFAILHDLWNYGATSYRQLTPRSRQIADEMVVKGWLRRESSLLTLAEAGLFNYYLNQVEFENGPNLRNNYLHGSQPVAQDDTTHQPAYVTALKLLVALVIKINDDLQIRSDQEADSSDSPAEAP